MAGVGAPALRLRVLVVDDEPGIRRTLAIALEAEGHDVTAVGNPADALAEAAARSFDLTLLDLRLGTASGMDLIPRLLTESPWMKVVVITAHATVDSAVEAMKRGAFDYLAKPFTPAQVSAITRKVGEMRALEARLQNLAGTKGELSSDLDLTSTSAAMQRAVSLARQVAGSDATVLIRGESGTGKGVLARAIHEWSPRAAKPFSVVSCPSLSPELLESELFGHIKGAFTGAVRDNPGRIAAGEGGTLLLDEIGDLPLPLQPKLLRFLQDRQFERVGDTRTRNADVRIVAATNADLEQAVKAGTFREDLYYRINVIQIDVPPLRERPGDILPLAERILASVRRGARPIGFSPEATEALRQYQWPGNVRELRNAVERGAILSTGERISREHLPAPLAGRAGRAIELGDRVSLDRLEEAHIRRVLAGSRSLEEAAEVLGIDVATLWRRRKKYGI
jgi:NtrC-family two-component system response regulator AlgB